MQLSASVAGVRRPEELDAWRFAWELKERVFAFTAISPALHDRRFCEEIRAAARSAPDNIAEGFYRFNPPDFANFLRIARGSLGEVRNQLSHARSSDYLPDRDAEELLRICDRAIGAITSLRAYLLTRPRGFDPRRLKARNMD